MPTFRKPLFASLGNTSIFMGPGRPEFDPKKGLKPYEEFLQESSNGMKNLSFDEGVIGSFMSGRFLNQANLPGFLPFLIPSLKGKPCVGVEGACGTGGKAIATAAKALLSDLADSVFVIGFEMQNRMKPLYGADVLAGAAHYSSMRKSGHAHFFPGLFDDRAKAYFDAHGKDRTRKAFAKWYEKAILAARTNPKSQEHFNTNPNLYDFALTPPNPETFLPHLTITDCSKVSDGAAAIGLFTEEGLKKHNIQDYVEIIGIGEAEGDISQYPEDLLELSTSKLAIQKALNQAKCSIQDIAHIEVHDCFSISGLLSIEALGLAEKGEAPDLVLSSSIPQVNLSGGLIGFGHPTGASGVRQLVDLWHYKKPLGLMVSMGGDDKTVTCIITRRTS